jgi:Bacterial SH3 domain
MTEARSPHPNDEWLVAYLTAGLSDDEQRGLDTHLQGCDRCVGSLSSMRRHLGMAAEVAVPVPAAVFDRVAGLGATAASSSARRPAPLSALLDRVFGVFRWPVLVPVAVAATALLVLVSQSDVTRPAPQQERSRAVSTRQTLPVTVPEAEVWPQPARVREGMTGGQVMATIKRGTRIAVVGEKGDWYQVTLPNGTTGWMERNAFE